MAKAKKRKTIADEVSELLELAEQQSLPEDFLKEEIEDECDAQSELQAENINSGILMGKIEFLLQNGWGVARLKELIQDGLDEE